MISAEEFATAGVKYIGRPYDRTKPGGMDCQDFYEQCARDCGLYMDLAGSNAWYRKFVQTGWTGTPEECKRKFGFIPKGATLFIHAFDGGEIKRGYYDGLGNASHIGIKTGTGEGAIHSSASRGCVCQSKFNDKTIPNGGWNMVGLSSLFDYGDKINRMLPGGGDTEPPGGDDPEEGGDEMPETREATVYSENGKPVKMRQTKTEPKNGKALYDELPVGTVVEVTGTDGEWCRVNYGKRTGWWIKANFLIFDADGEPDPEDDEPEGQDEPEGDGVQPGDAVTIRITAEEAVRFLTVVESIKEQIEAQIGRG